MFHLTRLLQSHNTWRRCYAVRACVLALGLACALTLYFLSPLGRRSAIAQTGTVVQNDFEDGSLQGWIPRGSVTLTNTNECPVLRGRFDRLPFCASHGRILELRATRIVAVAPSAAN